MSVILSQPQFVAHGMLMIITIRDLTLYGLVVSLDDIDLSQQQW